MTHLFASGEAENRESINGDPPFAWVWSQYRSELPQISPERPLPRTVALLNARGANNGTVAIGVVLTIVIIAGLTWLLSGWAVTWSNLTPQAVMIKSSLFGSWV